MKVTLISPRIAVQKGDFLGSGVPYWPVDLAVLGGYLRERGDTVTVVDLFGSAPRCFDDQGDHYLQGERLEVLLEPSAAEQQLFVVYAMSSMSHGDVLKTLAYLRRHWPNTPTAVMENSQAVTGYSLHAVAAELLAAGASGLICGDPYFNWDQLLDALRDPAAERPSNLITDADQAPPQRRSEKHARYAIPAWELFPLQNYWDLPYSHGPKTRTFLPILTSRGCPYPCDFCVVPATNGTRWRGRTPQDVVDELVTLRDRFNVHDFQVEDLNPTVRAARWGEIAELLIDRRAGVKLYFVSGTKAETIPLDQVPLLARAGLRYLSISPESGSKAVLRAIGKRFDYDHGEQLVRACRQHGIATQACFIVGHPSERDDDHRESRAYLQRLVRAGLDEVAIFIVSPLPGSQLHAQGTIRLEDAARLGSFSPRARSSYALLAARRQELIRGFFSEKLRRGADLWLQGLRSLFGVPRTKMENLPRRMVYVYAALAHQKLSGALGRHGGASGRAKP